MHPYRPFTAGDPNIVCTCGEKKKPEAAQCRRCDVYDSLFDSLEGSVLADTQKVTE